MKKNMVGEEIVTQPSGKKEDGMGHAVDAGRKMEGNDKEVQFF